jgi:tellurite resistance protein TerC
MEVTATAWAVTIGLIVALLAVDLAAGGLRPHAVGSGKPPRGRCSTLR